MGMTRILRRGTGRRRAIDRLHRTEEQLAACQADNARLKQWQTDANDYFSRLIIDRHDVFQAWEEAVMRATEAEIVAACTQMDCQRLAEENGKLTERLAAHDADTLVTDTRALHDRFSVGTVRALTHSPQAARPEHVPAWAMRGEPAA